MNMPGVILGSARTATGKFGGSLLPLRAVDLGATAMQGALERSGVEGTQIDEVIFGQVLQAGEGQITARQAATRAGIPMTVPAITINKVCLSGLAAIGLADRSIRLGESRFAMTGGMESMSNAPYVMPTTRWGARIGNTLMVDVLQHDGLYCPFDHCTMGESADQQNEQLGVSREEQDEWSVRSHERAHQATESGAMAREIVPIAVPQRKENPIIIDRDEGIRAGITVESLSQLNPAFRGDGTITAGNASQISDGGAAVVVAEETAAVAVGAPIAARILSYGQIGGVDATLHERPAEALSVALKKADLAASDLHVVEINEAFAAVSLWSARMLGIPEEKVNVHGGAVALGHPLGATGARLIVTLINVLQTRGGGLGAVTLCGGGGQGDAMVLEVLGE